jgi:predicted ATPase/DNA-binding SARP family transcriptional activator
MPLGYNPRPHTAMSARLSLSLFGPLEVRLDGRPVSGFEYNKVRGLLAYLAMAGRQPQPRAHLCELLWPNAPERAARQSLSQALTRLRHALRDSASAQPLILATTETIQLNPAAGLEVDAARFTDLLQAAESHAGQHRAWKLCTPCNRLLAEAAELYAGDFLAQFYLADSAPFEEWALLLRERFRQRMLSVLERLAQHAEWRGAWEAAAEHTSRMVALEPWLEGNQRALLRRLAHAGQPAAALAHYEYLRRMLAESLAIEPDTATSALARAIQAGRLKPPAGPPPARLPQPPTRLVGRQSELQAIIERLHSAETRALTLTGTPGIGKTRLALEAAGELRYDFEHGVYFVELAPLAEPGLVGAALAQALELTAAPGHTPERAVTAWLKDRHVLLVLDNFEHLLDAAAWVAGLLAACPGLKVLATSRAPLRIRAEQQMALRPLRADEAAQLFIERAAQARLAGGTYDPDEAIAEICARLDGLPLAIELIAGRAHAFSPRELLQQLDQRLAALTSGPRDLPERHRTLRSAIAWSYDRLGPEEQRLFAHLGVFAGGCTAAGAAAVAAPGAGGEELLPVLEQLVEHSLVQAHEAAGQTRYSLLETLREFALEQLEASGAAQAARQRQAAWAQALAEAAYQQLLGPDQARVSAELAAELDNLRAALRWAEEQCQVEASLRIATGLFRFWWQRGLLREGLAWFEPALAGRSVAPLEVQSRALRAAGILALGLNDFERARAWMEDAIRTGREAGDAYAVAAATTNLGLVFQEQGEWEQASQRLAKALALNRALPGQPHAVKFPLVVLAGLLLRMGRPEEAGQLYAEALRHNRELGDAEGTANSLYGLAVAAGARGDFDQARSLGEESLELYASLNHQAGQGMARHHLGNILRDAGQAAEAAAHYAESLRICLAREDAVDASLLFDDWAPLLGSQGRWPLAARLLAAAARLRHDAGARLTDHEHSRHLRTRDDCRQALGEAAFSEAWVEGEGLSLAEAVAEAVEAGSP